VRAATGLEKMQEALKASYLNLQKAITSDFGREMTGAQVSHMRRRLQLGIVLLGLIAPVGAQTISVDLSPRGIFAHVKIDGKDAVLLVDTGTVATTVDRSFVKGLKKERDANLLTAGGEVPGAVYRVDIQAGDVTQSVEVVAFDMQSFRRQAGVHIDGCLGLNVLTSKGAVLIDLHNRQVVLQSAK